jgi:hypothetical protein
MKSFEEIFKVGKYQNLKEFVALPIHVEATNLTRASTTEKH